MRRTRASAVRPSNCRHGVTNLPNGNPCRRMFSCSVHVVSAVELGLPMARCSRKSAFGVPQLFSGSNRKLHFNHWRASADPIVGLDTTQQTKDEAGSGGRWLVQAQPSMLALQGPAPLSSNAALAANHPERRQIIHLILSRPREDVLLETERTMSRVGDQTVQQSAENVVDDYGWVDAEGPHSCDYLAPLILDLLQSFGAQRVLDLGCGNGALCGTLFRNGFDVVGVEYDSTGVDLARRAVPSVTFYNFGLQNDPQLLLVNERPFDTVVSTEVIEHLYSPELLPRYAHQCLQRGGRVVVSTPYHGYLKNLALSVFDKWDQHHTVDWIGGHIKFWSRRTLTSLLERNGFSVENFVGAGRVPYLWKSMILVARKR